MSMFRPISAFLMAVMLIGCQAYVDGSKRTLGEVADDSQISLSVKARLVDDPEVKGLRINVDVRRGVVTLKGRVPSAYAKEKALNSARQTGSVVSVEDRLTIVE